MRRSEAATETCEHSEGMTAALNDLEIHSLAQTTISMSRSDQADVQDEEETLEELDVSRRNAREDLKGAASAHGMDDLGPLHTHSTWRGVYKDETGHATLAALRFETIDETRGEGCLRLCDQHGAVTKEARFDLVLSIGAPQKETHWDQPDVQMQLTFRDAEDADSSLQKSLSHLTLKETEMHPLRSPTAFRSLSLSPPPARHGSSSLSSSLPASSRRASFTPMSWASIVRGGPAELPPPTPVTEEEDEEQEFSFTKPNVQATPAIGIPGVALPNVFDEGEFPAPCSPPLNRPSRRRHASTGQMGAQPYLNAPSKPRTPICGSFWSHTRLTVVVKEGKAEDVLDLRYYGSSGSSQAWHTVPAVATRTLASAGRVIL